MNNDEEIIITTPQPVTPSQYAHELTGYIEQASCAVSLLGELLQNSREEYLKEGAVQSVGFLLDILGDGMMDRCMRAYDFVREEADRTATPPNQQPS